MVGTVPDNWAQYVPHMLERQGIESEGRWTDDNRLFELWIEEYRLTRAASVLRADSELNGYGFEANPELAEEDRYRKEALADGWDDFNWIDRLELEEGQYRVSIEVEDFRPHLHRLTWRGEESREIVRIDGREVLGVMFLVPKQHVRSIEFSYRGRSVPVSENLWLDCYAPHISRAYLSEIDFVQLTEVKGGVDLVLWGADGAVGYQVTWHLRTDGDHSRTIFTP